MADGSAGGFIPAWQLDCTTTCTKHSLLSQEENESDGAIDKSFEKFPRILKKKNMREFVFTNG